MKSLKQTILISFLSVTLIGNIAFFFTAIHYSRISVKDVFNDDAFVICDRINDTVSEVIQEKMNFLEYVAKLDTVKNEQIPLQQKTAFLLPLSKDHDKDLINLIYLTANGETLMGPTKMDFSSAPIIKMIKSEQKSVIYGPTVDDVTNTLTINIASPVKNDNGEMTGILLARLDCNFLCEISQRIRVGKTGYAIFIDRTTGNTIGAPQKEDVDNKQNLMAIAEYKDYEDLRENMKKLISGKTDFGYFTIGGVTRLMLYQPINRTSWSVCIMADESEVIHKLKSMENLLFTFMVVFLVVSILVSLSIARTLRPLKKVGDAISEIATGNADLSKRLEIKRGKKEILEIVNGFNIFVAKLQEIITSMKNSEKRLVRADDSLQLGTEETEAAITQIIANIQSVNNQINNQSDSVGETAGAVNEIASNIDSLENMIQNQSAGVAQASTAVEEMIGNISSVNNSVDIMFNSFKELEQNTNAGIATQSGVNKIIKQIEDQSKMLQDANTAIANIASRTNLLAMNAAIEAAHAGDSGKGFSVVADEIRKLSVTSTNQSKTIGEELQKIQESIHSVVNASSEATAIFTSVSQSIQHTDQLVQHIKAAMEEQQIGSKQITDALHAMNDSTIEVKSASAEMAEGNKHILQEINKLQNVTSVIKESIEEMSSGAQKINETGTALSEVSKEVTDSIDSIKREINLFKV
ncbi:MAG: methyl-accepting chemotaxis protein [Treponema sp.]|nr:methyl-accepting chemotaxis protein [Treponema sp.]